MQERSILLVNFEGGEQLGTTLRGLLEACPNPDFKLICHDSKSLGGNGLSDVIIRRKPSLILLALPRTQLQSLDAVLRMLRSRSSTVPVVVVADNDQKQFDELLRPGVADFIISPLRESEVLVRLRRLLNQMTESYEEPINSLAVIPLEAADEDMSVEYLSDGITESIINNLSRVPKLRVLACSTVFRFKGREIDPQDVGQRLNVKAVTMIRVIRLGEKLIIRSELVKVSDGSQLWGEQYNRSPSDILAIQDEIAKAITESLKFKLTHDDHLSVAKRSTDNNEAYNFYLRGRYFWNKYTKEGVLKAIEEFNNAIKIDSNYALAYCGLADAYFRLSNVHLPPHEVLPKAKEAALKALEIDENLAEAHASLGLVNVYYDYDWNAAEREFREALRLNPDLVLAHQRLGSYLTFIGRFEEANRYYEQALELAPFSLQLNVNLATTYYLRGESDRAIYYLTRTSELDPSYMPTAFVLGCVYIQQGRFNEAIEQFQRVCKLDEEAYLAMGFMGYAHALAGQRAQAEALLNVLQEVSRRKYVSPYSMLVIHLALGPEERVFELFDQLFEERNDWLVWLKVSPELRTIRNDPRFKSLMRRVGFPD